MEVLRFQSLQDIAGLRHVVTTRHGGAGPGANRDFNLAYHVGDDGAMVSANRRHLMTAAGLPVERLVAAQQVHGTNIHVAGAADAGRGALDWDSALPATDGILVADPRLAALILVADCAPVLMVDRARRILAVTHAGWRGAAAGIAGRAVQLMRESFGCRVEDIAAGIGPCLCTACLEVGEEVAAAVRPAFPTAVRAGARKPHLDLRAIIASDLAAHGVAPEQVEVMPQCPRCDVTRFFSHRGEQGKTGRFGLMAWWDEI